MWLFLLYSVDDFGTYLALIYLLLHSSGFMAVLPKIVYTLFYKQRCPLTNQLSLLCCGGVAYVKYVFILFIENSKNITPLAYSRRRRRFSCVIQVRVLHVMFPIFYQISGWCCLSKPLLVQKACNRTNTIKSFIYA